MKTTTLAIGIGVIVAALGVLGLVSGEGRIAEAMNIDLMVDLIRIALGGMLIIGGIRSTEAARSVLLIFAVAYLGMFVVGLVSPELFGLAPAGLGLIDQALNLGGGAVALFFAMTGARRHAMAA